jgi:hypothetical protein
LWIGRKQIVWWDLNSIEYFFCGLRSNEVFGDTWIPLNIFFVDWWKIHIAWWNMNFLKYLFSGLTENGLFGDTWILFVDWWKISCLVTHKYIEWSETIIYWCRQIFKSCTVISSCWFPILNNFSQTCLKGHLYITNHCL